MKIHSSKIHSALLCSCQQCNRVMVYSIPSLTEKLFKRFVKSWKTYALSTSQPKTMLYQRLCTSLLTRHWPILCERLNNLFIKPHKMLFGSMDDSAKRCGWPISELLTVIFAILTLLSLNILNQKS